jgi:nicotinate-nucleotide--dimethylbenzimidazole phosphoribosyltransferase
VTAPHPSLAEIRGVVDSFPHRSAPDWGATIARPRIALFAATHGLAFGVPGGAPQAMARELALWTDGGGPLAPDLARIDCDLRLYELAIDQPTDDSRRGPAMTDSGAALALAYGMMAVEPGVDLLVLGALGAGAVLAGRLVRLALLGGEAPGGDAALLRPALLRHAGLADPLEILAALGGPDIAAILGAILASRLAGVPVILDGVAAEAAAAVAWTLRPDAIDHCRLAASASAEGRATARRLPLETILDHPLGTPEAGVRALARSMGG